MTVVIKIRGKRSEEMFTSANTSVNKNRVPTLFKHVHWEPGTINVDYGAGKYDTATRYLAGFAVMNLCIDPYNLPQKENAWIEWWIHCRGGADTVTCSNVLNVIQDEKERYKCIWKCWEMLKYGGTAYFKVYEGDGSGIGRQTGPDQWQENRKTDSYISEITEVFSSAYKQGCLIIAK